jgi:hypothetical protein
MTYFIGIVGAFVLANFILSNLTTISFHIIHLFSRIQLALSNHTTQHKNKFIKKDADIADMLDCLVGNQLIKCNTSENVIEKINGSQITVLISGKNMVCFYPPIIKYYANYEESDVRFISVKIEINSVEFDIKMAGPAHSFYVVGNDLNLDWVRYYFLKFNNIELSKEVEYILTIIDDDVNFIEINQNECLSLEKNEYNVYTYEDEDDDNEDEFDIDLETEKHMMAEMKEEEEEEEMEPDDDCDCDIASIIAEYEMTTVESN